MNTLLEDTRKFKKGQSVKFIGFSDRQRTIFNRKTKIALIFDTKGNKGFEFIETKKIEL